MFFSHEGLWLCLNSQALLNLAHHILHIQPENIVSKPTVLVLSE